jgi:hypothetical protein
MRRSTETGVRVAALAGSLLALACGARSELAWTPPDHVDAAPALPALPAPPTPRGPTAFGEDPEQARADRIDLLFVIDDSGSMADKQQILARALPDMVARLINPLCVQRGTLEPVTDQPESPLDDCPSGTLREFNSVQDLHVGVVSSSLGGVGASNCGPSMGTSRRGRLLSGSVDTYEDQGFVAWDPAGAKSPPGTRDLDTFRDAVSRLLAIGEGGCPYEMPLEAMYRFLVDPEPYDRVVVRDCQDGSGLGDCSYLDGIDATVLEQRRAFLRPDSLVAIVLLSDENDCSIAPGTGHLMFVPTGTLPRGTSVCAESPSDPCCQSCGDPPRTGCPPPAGDPECQRGPYTTEEDGGYLRCFDPKRRLGVDRRHPTDRYIGALRGDAVPRRDGALVPNPLFHGPQGEARDPSLVFFASIAGVPWQDIAVDYRDRNALTYKTAPEMHADGTWDLIVGRPERGEPPGDPLMHESIAEREGHNPVTGDALAPSSATDRSANPINGHEALLSPTGFSLQTACIFDLPAPVSSYECGGFGSSRLQAVCRAPDGSYGSLQYRGAAYPGLRQLEVLRGLGDHAIVASICARNVDDPSRSDFGYRPALKAILDRLRVGID